MKDWSLANRANRMSPSVIREILKVTEQPHIISFAGGLPAPETFPIDAFGAAYEKVMHEYPQAALQYATSEGYSPLREWVAQSLPWSVKTEQVLITTGSQQALDLIGKIFIDEGSRVMVQTPTYLGALQAFSSYEPEICAIPNCVDSGCIQLSILEDEQLRRAARFLYLLPNFQNPTAQTMDADTRMQLAKTCDALGLPIVEDNPYGELWFDAPPPPPVSSYCPENSLYLGSLSKVLAPGLRLGYVVVPEAIFPQLLQAKQAADLHTPSLNQRLAFEVLIKSDFMQTHVVRIRQQYKTQCHNMLNALQAHMPNSVTWNTPHGGMFLWLRLPKELDSAVLLPKALKNGVAYVPGSAFYAGAPEANTLRLSFVTATTEQIDKGIALLAQTIVEAIE